jgi:hypothetical protein
VCVERANHVGDDRDPATVPNPTAAALELLASCRDGCTETIMTAHGFKTDMMVEIINGGLASVTTEGVVAAGRRIEVARVRITEAGRRALAGTTINLDASGRQAQ